MDELDSVLEEIATNGIMMTPETVKLKSLELNREFNKFKKDFAKERELEEEELSLEEEFAIYQCWVGNRLAVADLTLGKILDFFNGDE